jgi:hypothetical protein
MEKLGRPRQLELRKRTLRSYRQILCDGRGQAAAAPVAHQSLATVVGQLVGMAAEQGSNLSLNRPAPAALVRRCAKPPPGSIILRPTDCMYHLLYLLELRENNALIVYSPLLSSQIPASYAANAFHLFAHGPSLQVEMHEPTWCGSSWSQDIEGLESRKDSESLKVSTPFFNRTASPPS